MIPDDMIEELSPARSYGLIESVGLSKTSIDQTGGDTDQDYFELCCELYGGEYQKVYCPRPEAGRRSPRESNRVDR